MFRKVLVHFQGKTTDGGGGRERKRLKRADTDKAETNG